MPAPEVLYATIVAGLTTGGLGLLVAVLGNLHARRMLARQRPHLRRAMRPKRS